MKVLREFQFTKLNYNYVTQYRIFLKINLFLLIVNSILGSYLVYAFLLYNPKDTPYYVSTLTQGIEPILGCYLGKNKLGRTIKAVPSRDFTNCSLQWGS